MTQKEILIISITLFLTIIAWILGDLYHVANTNKVKVIDKRFLNEIHITINRNILDTLAAKK